MEARTPDDVQAALDALGLDIQVQLFETSTATSQEAADSVGTSLGSIAKSLCFLVGGQPLVAGGDHQHRLAIHQEAQTFGDTAQTGADTASRFLRGRCRGVKYLHLNVEAQRIERRLNVVRCARFHW